MTIKPQESGYTSHVAYTRALECYCAEIEADLRAASMSAAWQGFEINELRAELERLKAQEHYCFAVVDPANEYCKFDDVVFTAHWPEACHEHINDAITEHGNDSAGRWVVRKLYLAAGAQP